MSVTVIRATENIAAADPQNFTHGVAGDTPKGIVVLIAHGTVSTDIVAGVTFDGVALTRIRTNVDTATEPGRSYIYFLGSGVPTGAKTVSVDRTQSTTTVFVCAISLAASTPRTESIDNDGISENAANPQVTLQFGGREAMSFCVLYGGGAAPSSYTSLADQTRVHDHDLGAFAAVVDRLTTAQTADDTIGYTAASDDVAFSAFAVAEVEPFDETGRQVGPIVIAPISRDLAVLKDLAIVRAPVADGFNRADSTSLGADWTEDEDFSNLLQIVGNRLRTHARDAVEESVQGLAFYKDVAGRTDQHVSLTFRNLVHNALADFGSGLFVRGSGTRSAFTGYGLWWDGPAAAQMTFSLFRFDNSNLLAGGDVSLGSYGPIELTDGDILALEVSGTALRVWLNSQIIISATDANIALGRVGIWTAGVTSSPASYIEWDDFRVGIGIQVIASVFDTMQGFQTFNETRQVGPIIITASALSQLLGVDKVSVVIAISPSDLARLIGFDFAAVSTELIPGSGNFISYPGVGLAVLAVTPSEKDLGVFADFRQVTTGIVPQAIAQLLATDRVVATAIVTPSVLSTAAFRDLPLAIVQIIPTAKDRAVLTDKDGLTIVILPTVSDQLVGTGNIFNENRLVTATIIATAFNQLIAQDRPGLTIPFVVGETDSRFYSELSSAAIQVAVSERDRVVFAGLVSEVLTVTPTVSDRAILTDRLSASLQIVVDGEDVRTLTERGSAVIVLDPKAMEHRVLTEAAQQVITILSQGKDTARLVDVQGQTLVIIPSVSDLLTNPLQNELIQVVFTIITGVGEVFWPIRFSAGGTRHEPTRPRGHRGVSRRGHGVARPRGSSKSIH